MIHTFFCSTLSGLAEKTHNRNRKVRPLFKEIEKYKVLLTCPTFIVILDFYPNAHTFNLSFVKSIRKPVQAHSLRQCPEIVLKKLFLGLKEKERRWYKIKYKVFSISFTENYMLKYGN